VSTKKSKTTVPTKKAEKKQNDLIVIMILSLILGLGGGYLIGSSVADTSKDSSNQTTMHMDHSKYEVTAEQAPTVSLSVEEDAKSGYNIKIMTTNFTFTPENVNGENVVGEGHAHLYVGDEKIGRVYGNYYHYNGSFEGTKTFRVTLNTNDHSDYAVDGVVIESKVDVTHDSSDPNHKDDHMDEEKMPEQNKMQSENMNSEM
jgi:hypothetical protein